MRMKSVGFAEEGLKNIRYMTRSKVSLVQLRDDCPKKKGFRLIPKQGKASAQLEEKCKMGVSFPAGNSRNRHHDCGMRCMKDTGGEPQEAVGASVWACWRLWQSNQSTKRARLHKTCMLPATQKIQAVGLSSNGQVCYLYS